MSGETIVHGAGLEGTAETVQGTILGTPRYLSPEQGERMVLAWASLIAGSKAPGDYVISKDAFHVLANKCFIVNNQYFFHGAEW